MHLPGWIEENHEQAQDSQFQGQDLNLGASEYETGVLTVQLWCSVYQMLLKFCLNDEMIINFFL